MIVRSILQQVKAKYHFLPSSAEDFPFMAMNEDAAMSSIDISTR